MIRRLGKVPARLFRPCAIADAGVFFFTLTLALAPWRDLAVVPTRFLREISVRLAPGTVPLLEMVPPGLSLVAVFGAVCVALGSAQAVWHMRRTLYFFPGIAGLCIPTAILLAAGLISPGLHDPDRERDALISLAGSAAVGVAGYLLLASSASPRRSITRVFRALAVSCAAAAVARLLLPLAGFAAAADGSDPLAFPLSCVLAFYVARFIRASAVHPAELIRLTVLALLTAAVAPLGALVALGVPTGLGAWRLFRKRSPEAGNPYRYIGAPVLLMAAILWFGHGLILGGWEDLAKVFRSGVSRLAHSGWMGAGPGGAENLIYRSDQPWSLPMSLPWLGGTVTESGAAGIAVFVWLVVLLWRNWRSGTRGLRTGVTDADMGGWRVVVLSLLLILPVRWILFFPMAACGMACTAAQEPGACNGNTMRRPGACFFLGGYLIVGTAALVLLVNGFRFAWLNREAAAAAASAAKAWEAEQSGAAAMARSGWSDAAWRVALVQLLDESTDPASAPGTVALRVAGMDRLLAVTPGWFSHPAVRGRMPWEWPLPRAARDAAHFGQARAA